MIVVTQGLIAGGKGDHRAVGHAQAERREPWLDAVNATDNPSAHAHAAPLAVAIGLIQRGVEPIMQLTCRDAIAWRYRPTSSARRCTESRTSAV
jgi:5,10-methylenetetrahydrofolate reductase